VARRRRRRKSVVWRAQDVRDWKRYRGLPTPWRAFVSKYLVVRIRGWREYDRADDGQQPFSLLPGLRFAPVALLAALIVWLISLSAPLTLGPLDPVAIGGWTMVGTFAGCVCGTMMAVAATERSRPQR
jgi:hypothetical protein